MKLDLMPLLQKERALYGVPRGGARFQAYIRAATGDTDDIEIPPLGIMNPMAKEHVAHYIETLIALHAEAVVAAALFEAERRLPQVAAQFKVGLVVADDVAGGWTNRYFAEHGMRFALKAGLKRGWISVVCWASEAPTREAVHALTLASVYRAAYVSRHGEATTLDQMLRQEGLTAVFAHVDEPMLPADELAYSHAVIAPHRNADAYPIVFAFLYGDEAAASLGYPTLGLSPRAGYALALAEAQTSAITPEMALL